MTVRPSLIRSIPFWILLAGSVATSAIGTWLAVDKLGVMATGLEDGTATPGDVYVGQAWAIIGGILIATGMIGLALALVVAVLRSFAPVPDIEIIDALDWSENDEQVADQPVDVSGPTVESEPATSTEPAPQR